MQSVKAAPSRLHSNSSCACAATLSVPSKVNVIDPLTSVIDVSGALVSTIQVRLAGSGSMLPVLSTARIRAVCSPAASGPNTTTWLSGGSHSANGAPSSEHSKVTSVSLAESSNDALVSEVTAGGPETIVVSGSRSTSQPNSSGESSTMPCALRARTKNR